MTATYRARRAGSVRFDPYYKLEVWETRRLAWTPIQRRHESEASARAAFPAETRVRLYRVSEAGRVLVSEH